MLAGQHGHVNYDAIPGVVYTWPEMAWVGLSEEDAKAAGREIATLLQAASRSVRLYPASNPQVRRTVAEFTTAVRHIFDADERFELRIAGDFLFINDLRLRLERDETSAIEFVRSYLRDSGVEGVGLMAAATEDDWRSLFVMLNSPQGKQSGDRFLHLERRLAAASVQVFAIRPAALGEGGAGGGQSGKQCDKGRGLHRRASLRWREYYRQSGFSGPM